MAGYTLSLLLRLLGGETYLNFPATMAWPWYDEVSNVQHFPFRTACMLIGLITNVAVSYLTKYLFENGILDGKHDRWNAIVNDRVKSVKYFVNDSEETEMKGSELYGAENPGLQKEDKM